MTFTLYFREYCSLCHRILAELAPWRAHYGFELEILDIIDDDPKLVARFDELVPVLMADDTEICRYHFEGQRLAAYLGEIGYNPR